MPTSTAPTRVSAISRPPSLLRFGYPILVLVALVAMLGLTRRDPAPRTFTGGTYHGRIPGGGEIRLHQFSHFDSIEERWVDEASGTWAIVGPDDKAPQQLWGPAERRWGPEATLSARVSEDGKSAVGTLRFRTVGPQSLDSWKVVTFPLIREYRHRGFQERSGLMIGRFGAQMHATGQFPEFDESNPFGIALNRELQKITEPPLLEFMGKSLQQQWDALRCGWPATMSDWSFRHHVEVRTKTQNLVSLAVFTYPDRGGNGDPTRWSALNYIWADGKLMPLDLSQLFHTHSDWVGFLREYCLTDLDRQRGLPTEIDHLPLNRFTLSTGGLQFLFNPYEVGSGAEGALVVHIPWQRLEPWLRRIHPTVADDETLPTAIAELVHGGAKANR